MMQQPNGQIGYPSGQLSKVTEEWLNAAAYEAYMRHQVALLDAAGLLAKGLDEEEFCAAVCSGYKIAIRELLESVATCPPGGVIVFKLKGDVDMGDQISDVAPALKDAMTRYNPEQRITVLVTTAVDAVSALTPEMMREDGWIRADSDRTRDPRSRLPG